jgi:DNA mismatch repair protein MutL
MSKIRVLSDHVANQIAAGEVVERPASVAKELVENSIDAGATRITVEIEAGGRRLLKISDDGEGMVRDDAVLAFERHATSKISGTEDLNAIATLGFR